MCWLLRARPASAARVEACASSGQPPLNAVPRYAPGGVAGCGSFPSFRARTLTRPFTRARATGPLWPRERQDGAFPEAPHQLHMTFHALRSIPRPRQPMAPCQVRSYPVHTRRMNIAQNIPLPRFCVHRTMHMHGETTASRMKFRPRTGRHQLATAAGRRSMFSQDQDDHPYSAWSLLREFSSFFLPRRDDHARSLTSAISRKCALSRRVQRGASTLELNAAAEGPLCRRKSAI